MRALSRNSAWLVAFRAFVEAPTDPDLRANVEFMLQRVVTTDPSFLGQLRTAVDAEKSGTRALSPGSVVSIALSGSKHKVRDVAGRDINKNRTIKIGSGVLAALLLAGGGSYTAYKATDHGVPDVIVQQKSEPFPISAYTPTAGTLCLLSSKEASALEHRTVEIPGKFKLKSTPFCEYLPPGTGTSLTKVGLEISAFADATTFNSNGKYSFNGDKVSPAGQFTAAWVWPSDQFTGEISGVAAARLPSGAVLSLVVNPRASASRQELIEGIDLVMNRFHYSPHLRAVKGNRTVLLPEG